MNTFKKKKELRTEILIDASASTVWRILTDFDQYPSWNPFIKKIMGALKTGASLEVLIEAPGGKPMTFKPKVVQVSSNKTFRWIGRLLMPGLFDGMHVFEIEELKSNQVRFTHREEFKGLLLPLLWKSLDKSTRQGFEAMNRAIKEQAESAM